MDDILNELQYGVALCKKDGTLVYINPAASNIFNCSTNNIENYNILSFIDSYFHNQVRDILTTPEQFQQSTGSDFIFFKIKDITSKVFKLKFKSYKENQILLMMYDYTEIKVSRDTMFETIKQMNNSITKNNLILKTISDICKNIFYKDRSYINDILLNLSVSFKLAKAAICFKNGTRHIIYCRKLEDGTYEDGKIDGDEKDSLGYKNCKIWQQEKYFINDKELIFTIPCKETCAKTKIGDIDFSQDIMHVLKLKLDNNKVVGFFEFIEDKDFQLSNSDLELLESLSQILAYIINNKEQVLDVTKYIKDKFSNIKI